MNRIDMKTIEEQFAASIAVFVAGVRRWAAMAAEAFRSIRAGLQRTCLTPVATSPAPFGNVMALLSHLVDWDENMRIWFCRWLAYQLRNPGAKMATAVILNGGRSSGKRLFLKYVVTQLFNEDAPWIHARQLHNVFNDWASDGGLVIVEGPVSTRHVARMKAYITSSDLTIESRGREARTIPNSLNFIYLSHTHDFLPMDMCCRRFTVIDVPPARQIEFYHAVLHEIAHGGVESFRHYLLHGLDMGNFNSSTPAPAPQFLKPLEVA